VPILSVAVVPGMLLCTGIMMWMVALAVPSAAIVPSFFLIRHPLGRVELFGFSDHESRGVVGD